MHGTGSGVTVGSGVGLAVGRTVGVDSGTAVFVGNGDVTSVAVGAGVAAGATVGRACAQAPRASALTMTRHVDIENTRTGQRYQMEYQRATPKRAVFPLHTLGC